MGLGDVLRYAVFADVISQIGPKLSNAFNTVLAEKESLLSSLDADWNTTIPENIYIPILGTSIVFDLRAAEEVWDAMPWATIMNVGIKLLGVVTWTADVLDLITIPGTDEFLYKDGETIDYGKNFDPVKKISLYDIYVVKIYWKILLSVISIVRNILDKDASKHFVSTVLGMGSLYISRRNSATIIQGVTKTMAASISAVDLTQMESDLSDVNADLDTIEETIRALTYKPYG